MGMTDLEKTIDKTDTVCVYKTDEVCPAKAGIHVY
jgi:hypothetical protein